MSTLEFYRECKRLGIEKLETQAQREKAKLVAQKYGIHDDIDYVLNQELCHENKSKADEKIRIDEDKVQEAKAAEEEKIKKDANEQLKMSEPYPYYGREKRIAYYKEKILLLQKEIDDLNRTIRDNDKLADAVINSALIQQKNDWAIAGGIAQAIAGPAAGIAVAVQVQNENEKIDAQNSENIKIAVALSQEIKLASTSAKQQLALKQSELDSFSKKIDEICLNLVEDIKDINPIKLMKISGVQITPSNIELIISLKKSVKIFGDVDAVLDGSFWVHIYQSKDYIGSVRIVLPLEGITTSKACINVGTSLGIDEKLPCYFEFEAEKLWLIEK